VRKFKNLEATTLI